MSVPLFLPVLEQWRGMTSSVAVSWSFLPSVSFSAALSLAAMFTALAFLFICLLKTAHARVSRTIMLLALACYAIGYGLLDLWSFGALDGSVVEAGSGLMMGFGAAVMCLVWMSRLHCSVQARSLAWSPAASCSRASLLPMLERACRTVHRGGGAVRRGCARLFFRSEKGRAFGAGRTGGRVRAPRCVGGGTGDFKTPLLARCSSPLCHSPAAVAVRG
ncbi:MAG: hypothetical protein ACLSVD_12075 [Eggerthellaceae bacterium]